MTSLDKKLHKVEVVRLRAIGWKIHRVRVFKLFYYVTRRPGPPLRHGFSAFLHVNVHVV